MNSKCSQISDEKKTLSLWQITFDPSKLGSKVIYGRGKKEFIIRNLRAFAFIFAGT